MPVPLSQPISVAEAAAVHPTYADVLAWFERATGRPASVVRDPDGVIRFARNRLAVWLHEEQGVSLSAATIAYYHGQFAVGEYAEFVAGLGYSLSGFADLSAFSGHILARGRGGSGAAVVTFLRDWPNAAFAILIVAAVVAVAF